MKDYTTFCAIALKNGKVELHKNFDKSYSVVTIDKHGNETHHIRSTFGRANTVYEVEKSKLICNNVAS